MIIPQPHGQTKIIQTSVYVDIIFQTENSTHKKSHDYIEPRALLILKVVAAVTENIHVPDTVWSIFACIKTFDPLNNPMR